MTPRELYYQIGKETVLYQNTLHRELSDRAFNLLNLGVATIAAAGVIVNLQSKDLEWGPLLMSLGALSLFAFVVVAVLSLRGMRGADWYGFPILDDMAHRIAYLEENYPAGSSSGQLEALQSIAGNHFQSASFNNELKLSHRRREQFWTIVFLAVEMLAVISLVVLIFWGTQTPLCGEALAETVQCASQ